MLRLTYLFGFQFILVAGFPLLHCGRSTNESIQSSFASSVLMWSKKSKIDRWHCNFSWKKMRSDSKLLMSASCPWLFTRVFNFQYNLAIYLSVNTCTLYSPNSCFRCLTSVPGRRCLTPSLSNREICMFVNTICLLQYLFRRLYPQAHWSPFRLWFWDSPTLFVLIQEAYSFLIHFCLLERTKFLTRRYRLPYSF